MSLWSLDYAVFHWANRVATDPALDWLLPRLTELHRYLWFQIAMVALIGWQLGPGKRAGRVWVLCVILAIALSDGGSSQILKKFFLHRDRPCHQQEINKQKVGPYSLPETRLIGTCPGSYGLPSNHSCNMAALATVCWWFARRRAKTKQGRALAALWFLIPLIIGYTRLYVGAHYPTDVIAGWAWGALVALGVVRFVAMPLLPKPAVEPAPVLSAEVADEKTD